MCWNLSRPRVKVAPMLARKPLVFVSGPYTQGDPAVNVGRAVAVADEILTWPDPPGLCVPHLNHLWHLLHPHPYAVWMALDLQLLLRCDAVLRVSGTSPGADEEVAVARRIGLPVFTSLADLAAWCAAWRG